MLLKSLVFACLATILGPVSATAATYLFKVKTEFESARFYVQESLYYDEFWIDATEREATDVYDYMSTFFESGTAKITISTSSTIISDCSGALKPLCWDKTVYPGEISCSDLGCSADLDRSASSLYLYQMNVSNIVLLEDMYDFPSRISRGDQVLTVRAGFLTAGIVDSSLTPVPLPASGWLFLLVAPVFAWLRRRSARIS